MVQGGILHVHSMFSLNDSTQSPEEIVKRAVELGCQNITLTDHGTLFGIDDFMEAGEKYGINTIPGVEAYLENRQHLVLIAKNYEGFQAISSGIRNANEHQEIKKIKGTNMVFPIMTKEDLEKFRGNENVIATSACIQGPICSILLRNYHLYKQIEKLRKKQESYSDSYHAYIYADENYNRVINEIRAYKDDQKAFVKYTKDPFQRGIDRLHARLTEKQNKINDLTVQATLTPAQTRKLEKLESECNSIEKEIDEKNKLKSQALEVVAFSDKKIAYFTSLKKKWKSERDENKSKKETYEKLEKNIQNIRLFDENKLYEEAKSMALFFQALFPNFYLELQYHGLKEEGHAMPLLVKIADETGIPFIAANDAHMTDGSEKSITARQIVRYNYFSKHQTASETDHCLYLKSDEELASSLHTILPETIVEKAIENTKILSECHVVFPDEKHYPVCKSEKSFHELLREAKEEKIKKGLWSQTHEDRLNHEIEVIESMGFVDYHMIVRSFCIAGRELGVVPKHELPFMPITYNKALEWIKMKGFTTGVGVGPGRGSAAGSLVCYLLGITNIDPIKYGLLFERYLNPERVTMPDIDTDIKTSLRPYIIRLLKEMYGERSVCSIMTITTYAAKAAVQMVGRDRADELYGLLPKAEQDAKKKEYLLKVRKITDLLPEVGAGKLQAWDYLINEQFSNDSEAMLLWERAKLIEGKARGTGIHAGGVVISDNDNINQYVPLAWKDEEKVWAAQRDMVRIESKGLLKMDILGLLTLDCTSDCLNLIKKNYGVSINLDTIPFEEEVFREIYSKGRTNSIFQVESQGMRNMMMDFQPTCIEDIILLLAAYRPGPMEFLPRLIEVKHGRAPLTYLTPELEPILSTTYGQIIYQEEVMQIFQELAGYSLGQADLVRRAMSKKKEEKLLIERKAFVYGDADRNICGCIANGISEDIANKLFDNMTDFAKYAFNKSHAAAYAVVSYQTAWLKYHYPKEFLCSMFNNKPSDSYEPIIEDCRMYQIEILPPDINYSYYEFVTEGEAIRYGFSGIKNISDTQYITQIIQEREGSRSVNYFKSFCDFAERFLEEGNGKCTFFEKRFMDALIKSGCFDEIEENRVHLYSCYQNMELANKKAAILAGISAFNAALCHENTKTAREWEIEYLRYFIRENPLKGYHDDSYYGCIPYNEIEDGHVNVFGLLTSYESKISKNGNKMLIVNLQGNCGKISALFLKEKCEFYLNEIESFENSVIRISGSCKDGTIFGKSMERLNKNKSTYSYICDTQEKYKLLLQACHEQNGLEELNVFTFYKGKSENSIERLPFPVMMQLKVTKKILKILNAEKER